LFEGHNIILHTGFFPYFLGICNESRKTNNTRPTSLPEDTRAQSTTTHSRDHVALYSYFTAWTGLTVTLYGCVVPCCHLPKRQRSTCDPTKFQFRSFSPSRICYHQASWKEKRKTADEGISRLDKSCILVVRSKTPASAVPPIYVPSSY